MLLCRRSALNDRRPMLLKMNRCLSRRVLSETPHVHRWSYVWLRAAIVSVHLSLILESTIDTLVRDGFLSGVWSHAGSWTISAWCAIKYISSPCHLIPQITCLWHHWVSLLVIIIRALRQPVRLHWGQRWPGCRKRRLLAKFISVGYHEAVERRRLIRGIW